MLMEPQHITLKDGRMAVLRCAVAADAAECLALLRQCCAETDNLLRRPEEWDMTVEQEEHFLQGLLENPDALMLQCVVDGCIVGNCNLTRHTMRKTRHRADIGLCILQEYWGLGIGTAMFKVMIEQGRAWGLRQLELEVAADNQRGLALYRKMGFEVYGERPVGMLLPDGTPQNEILMQKVL